MGAIRRQGSNEVEYLHHSHTIGRAQSCHLVLDRRAISGHHATLRWSEGEWTLRDLGSRNGTYLNGRRVPGGPSDRSKPLAEGDVIVFAESDAAWEFIDLSEPKPLLIPLEPDREPIELDAHDILALPSTEAPVVTIYQRQGTWEIEREGVSSPLVDGQVLRVGEDDLRVRLIETVPATADAESLPIERLVKDLSLSIKVAPNEELAAVDVQIGEDVHEFPERTFLYLLAFLARRRIAEAPTLEADAGWVPVDLACHELNLPGAEALGLLVYRCRKTIKRCQVQDPVELIDRSRRGWLRVGVPAQQLSVTRLK